MGPRRRRIKIFALDVSRGQLQAGKALAKTNNFAVPNDSHDFAVSRESWKTRERMEEDEARMLALFAQNSRAARGRKFPEPRHSRG
jgi:hypothetical protein